WSITGLLPRGDGDPTALVVAPDRSVYRAQAFGGGRTPSGAGVFKSADGGATWTDASVGLSRSVLSLTVAPHTGVLWAGTDRAGAFRSEDGGRTWLTANDGLDGPKDEDRGCFAGEPCIEVTALAVDPSNERRGYAGSRDDGYCQAGRVFRTGNDGRRWAKL